MSKFGAIGGFLYLIYGIVCLLAVMDGVQVWFGINAFFAFFVALIIAYIPIVATVAGYIGATDAWGWSFLHASALFFGPMVVGALFFIISASLTSRK